MDKSVINPADGGNVKKAVKSVEHWALFIIKILVILTLLPFGMLYFWVKWRIARHAFVRAASAAGIDKTEAFLLSRELSPLKLLSGYVRK